MPKVLIPQVPHRRDSATSLFVPAVDISRASAHGDISVLLPPHAPFHDAAGILCVTMKQLVAYDFEAGDSIVALGDPFLIATLCGALGKLHGKFVLLKWDRKLNQYIKFKVDLNVKF